MQASGAVESAHGVGHLRRLASELRGCRSPEERLHLVWRSLTSTAPCRDPGPAAMHPDFPSLRETIRRCWQQALAAVERTQAEALVRSGRQDARSVLAFENYAGLAEELALVDGGKVDRLCVVGCGPFPETLLALARARLAPGGLAVGLDADECAARQAQAVIASLDDLPDGRVAVLHENGRGHGFSGYRLILVANAVEDKQGVLDRIAPSAGLDVLVRLPVAWGTVLYEDVAIDLRRWALAGTAYPSPLSRTVRLRPPGVIAGSRPGGA